jgi:hypothetical protein
MQEHGKENGMYLQREKESAKGLVVIISSGYVREFGIDRYVATR